MSTIISECKDHPDLLAAHQVMAAGFEKGTLMLSDRLSLDQAFTIHYHIGNGSSWLNDDLRSGGNLETPCKNLFAKQFDAALERLDSHHGITFRGDDPGDAEHDLKWFEKQIGKVIRLNHYLSTSKDYWDHKPVTWKIQCLPSNSSGKDISSLKPLENEVLFKRYAMFRIDRVDISGRMIFMTEMASDVKADIDLVRNYSSRQFPPIA